MRLNDPHTKLWPWLERIGAARKAGSVPIGWYQVHAAHAETILTEQCLRRLTAGPDARIKCAAGEIYVYNPGAFSDLRRKWQHVCSAQGLFNEADKLTRTT